MKNRLLISLLLWVCCQWAPAEEPLEKAIKDNDWPALVAQFGDDTHRQLADYFRECRGVGFSLLRQNDLMFFARFRDFAEIGEITYEKENGKYRQLNLKRNIKDLHFIDSFSRYVITERTIRIGDAEIYFKNGVMYQGLPMGNLFVFSGEWEFKIRPEDEEERTTLLHLLRSATFKKESLAGIFILSRPEEVAGLSAPAPASGLDNEEAKLLYEIFQKHWGMPISFFNEKWYFPFAADFNAVIFSHKPGKSYFRYIFNSANSPDTSLVLFPENKLYLNYNAVKGLKFVSQAVDELEKLQLNLFYNPQAHFLSGTAVLNFKEPSNIKTISLDPGLVVKGYGKSPQHELYLFNRADNYYLLGQELNKFSFYYAGNINPSEEASELVRMRSHGLSNKTIDHFYILSREQNFYPNPGQHFFKSKVKVFLPYPLQCLATGNLQGQQKHGERNEFVFESPGSKGISLVCGNFKKLLTIPSRVPIQVFGAADLRMVNFFSNGEVQAYFDFLLEKFGALEIRELNLLLRRWEDFGGVSNQGFVVFNLLDSVILDDDLSVIRRLRIDNPVFFTDVNKDNLVHELAHQWWGGVISWKSYQDQWLTEGLAQFSTLYYLQNTLAGKRFRKIIASAKKWVFSKTDSGPIVYGRRIANISNDLRTYQSIVYNKAALVFLMLKEILGEEEMLRRLQGILADFKYQSLTTPQFIRHFCQENKRLLKFFNGWVYSRKIPEVKYQIAISGLSAEVTFTQKETDFVFPVGILITSREGESSRTLIVEEKIQKFKIIENTPILSIQVDPLVSPLDLQD
jgi:hypothetical protein